jgi:hypothetical protein
MVPLVLVAMALASSLPAPSVDSSGVARPDTTATLRAARTSERLVIDGRLDEPAWSTAPVADRFIQRNPEEGRPVSERTEVRVLVGDDAITFGVRCRDHEPGGIRRRLVRRDENLGSDYFSVFIDSDHDHLTAYRFDVNPAGSYDDAAIDAQGNEDRSWDPIWQVAARTDSLGWTAEMEIPLSQLHFHRSADVWGIQFVRWIDRKQEQAEFAFTPKREHEDVSRYGHLTGLGVLAGRPHLELLPYTLAKVSGQLVAPEDPFRDHIEPSASIGGDLKYRLGGGLTLDATVHPDFGQVEVDPAVVNLTAVETFFPEKRPFFVERAELFAFGQTRSNNYFGNPIAFHARRIGRAPQGVPSGADVAFVDAPDQVPIAAAAKVTGKTAGGWSIGALDAVTNEARAQVMDLAGQVSHVPVEPLTNYLVGRVRREFASGQTSVGGIVTSTIRDHGDPTLDAQLRSRATVVGADFNHFWPRRQWSLDGYLLGSTVHGTADAIDLTQRASSRYYQRPDATHLTYDPTRTHLEGESGLVSLNKIGGEHWLGSLTYQETSPGFENNDVGFNSGADFRGLSTLLIYKVEQPARILRDWNVGIFSNNQYNFGGDLTYQGYESLANWTFANYWSGDARLSWFPSAFDDRLTRGGPMARSSSATRWWLTMQTDSRKSYLFRMRAQSLRNDAGGHQLTLTPSLTLRASTSLLIRFEPSIQDNRDMAQYVTTIADPTATATYGTRSVFATLDQHVVSLDTRFDWTFSPRLSLQLYLQPLVASGDYRDLKELRAPRTYTFNVYGTDTGTIQRGADGVYHIDPDGAGPAAPFDVPDPNFNFRSLLGNAVLRWEYRPGSAIFLVWQQHRDDTQPIGDFDFVRDFRALFEKGPENTIALKATYWFSL